MSIPLPPLHHSIRYTLQSVQHNPTDFMAPPLPSHPSLSPVAISLYLLPLPSPSPTGDVSGLQQCPLLKHSPHHTSMFPLNPLSDRAAFDLALSLSPSTLLSLSALPPVSVSHQIHSPRPLHSLSSSTLNHQSPTPSLPIIPFFYTYSFPIYLLAPLSRSPRPAPPHCLKLLHPGHIPTTDVAEKILDKNARTRGPEPEVDVEPTRTS